MKTKDLDFFNKVVDYSEFISNNKLIIEDKQIDLRELATEKYKDLTHITIENCTVLNQDTNFSIFKNLKTLDYHHNQLTSLPDLSKCSQLEVLSCDNNQLTSLPDLSNCSQLEWLDCTDNQLATLTDLANCSQLKWLDCNNNQLTSLPDLSNCSQLECLYCRNNQLTSLPDLSNCSQLERLYCENNQLTTCKSFYSVYKYSVDISISNNPIPQIEVYFVKNVNGIKDYYFDLFNYCVENNRSYKDFMEIEWPEDFYDNYILKVTSNSQKKYMNYITHDSDFDKSNDYLFNFD